MKKLSAESEGQKSAPPPGKNHALLALEKALDTAPLDVALHLTLATEKRACGDELGALAHKIAAQTIAAHNRGDVGVPLDALCTVAHGYFMKEDYATAERWYGILLRLAPHMAVAYQNLSAICSYTDRPEEAERYRQKAYALQRVFIESPPHPQRRLLILCSGRRGNVPFETLLSTGTCCRIKYAIDFAEEAEDDRLPAFDLVFNAIGDPDVAARHAERLLRFEERCPKPLLNSPAAVLQTGRSGLAGLLDGEPNVVVAPCVLCPETPAPQELQGLLQAAGIEFPVLARPEASHGGLGLELCGAMPELVRKLACGGRHHVTQYVDYASPDGFFRKYRMIFVDREPFPYHLAISPHWMVHYCTAEMEEQPLKLEEERRFLADPERALGTGGMNAVRAIGRCLDLDYCGVDFSVLADGRLLVFEANATMLVHRQGLKSVLAHKNVFIQRIVDAFEKMLAGRCAAVEAD